MKNHIMTVAESAKFAFAKETMLVARSANECIVAAAALPPQKKLFDNFWHEEELALLVGGTGTGKSLLGLQIADAISKGQPIPGFCMEAEKQKVLYLDTELDDRQLFSRYGSDDISYTFDDNLIRIVVDPEFNHPLYAGTALFTALERVIEEQGIKVLIADSLTGLRNMRNKYRGVEVDLLKFFLELKAKYHLSILVTVPTYQHTGMRIRHLSGKFKDLTAMADSVFAIGESNNNPDMRYLKQLKSRRARVTYHEHSVAVGRITHAGNFTGFKFLGREREEYCLRRSLNVLERAILALKDNDPMLSLGDIARVLGTYKMKVKRILDEHWLEKEEEEGDGESQWEVNGPQTTVDGGSQWSEVGSPSEGLEGDGESQWPEVGGWVGSLEQYVTQDSYQPSAFSNQKEEVDGPQSTDDRESQWLEVGGELKEENPIVETQEPRVTTENKLPEEPN